MTNIERAARYAAKCTPAISGSGGGTQTFTVACRLCHGFDLTEDETFTALRDGYNPILAEPWTERNLRRKAKDAFAASGTKPRGWLLTSAEDKAEESFLRETDHLHDYGILAMTGSMKWLLGDEITGVVGRHLILCADNDASGRKGSERWHAQLGRAGIAVEGFDWKAVGGTEGDDLNAYVSRALYGKEAA